jgi:hypothetical protein
MMVKSNQQQQQSSSSSSPSSSSPPTPPPKLSSTFSATSTAVPFYYHTCPQFQQEDLNRERAGLSAAERDEIDGDVAGTCAIVRESCDFVRARLHAFHGALEAIPLDEKESYLKAVEARSAAFVLEDESPPLAFLRAERFDAASAARRFVDYWSFRHKIFGDDRAFRNMMPGRSRGCEPSELDDDSDSGCMSDVDREAVRKGGAKALPPDALGRPVVFFKRNCVPKEVADHQPVFVRTLYTEQ